MKKKILFFLTSLSYGGTEKTTLSYLNELAKSDEYEILLCVMFQKTAVETLEASIPGSVRIVYLSDPTTGNAFHDAQISYSKGILYKMKYAAFRLTYNLLLEKKFHSVISSYQPTTLIQADSVMPSYFFKYKIPTKIIFVHFSLDHLFSGIAKKIRINNWAKKLKEFDYVLAISKRGYAQLEPYCLQNKLLLLYNPTFGTIIKPLSLMECRLPKGVTKNNYIVSVGRLDENQKDFSGLIRAIGSANQKFRQDYKLVIVGDGRDKTHLETLVAANHLQNNVHFVGNQKNPYPYIANSGLLVLSSKFEGFGNVLLEALLLDKLAISSDCFTGPSEILNHEKLLVPVGDHESLASKIHNLLSDKQLQTELYSHLNEQKKIFDPEESIKKLESILA